MQSQWRNRSGKHKGTLPDCQRASRKQRPSITNQAKRCESMWPRMSSSNNTMTGAHLISSQLPWAWHVVWLWRQHRKHTDTWREREVNNGSRSITSSKISEESGGTDGIQPELLKHAELITPCLTNLFNNVWRNKEVPTKWSNGIIMPLPKKVTCQTATTGGASHCYQYQTMCLQA